MKTSFQKSCKEDEEKSRKTFFQLCYLIITKGWYFGWYFQLWDGVYKEPFVDCILLSLVMIIAAYSSFPFNLEFIFPFLSSFLFKLPKPYCRNRVSLGNISGTLFFLKVSSELFFGYLFYSINYHEYSLHHFGRPT